MRSKYYVGTILSVTFLGIVSHQGCSHNYGIAVTAPSDLNASGLPIDQIIKSCNDAKVAGTLKTYTQNISFPDTRVESGRTQVCDFTADDLANGERLLRERYEQTEPLNVPTDAIICDVQMSSQQTQFQYDDHFYLTFNDIILASNHKDSIVANSNYVKDSTFTTTTNQHVDLYKYNWNSLYNVFFDNLFLVDYCLGADQGLATCNWPRTQEHGNIQFQFDPQILIALGLKSGAANQHFGFVVTGDNDPDIDCYHPDLQFGITVKYYKKN